LPSDRCGDPAGHTCFAPVGASEKAIRLKTGKDDRVENMRLSQPRISSF
jgi:hypothetical protein